MDDLFRNMKQHEEMIRRLNEPSLRYIQENEAILDRLREVVDTRWLFKGIDTSAIANVTAALDFKRLLPDPSGISELTKAMFTRLAATESILQMQRYADEHREISAAFARLATSYKPITEQISSMLSCIDAMRFAGRRSTGIASAALCPWAKRRERRWRN